MLLRNISKTRNDVELADLHSLSQGNLLFTYRKMIIKDKYTTSFLGGTGCYRGINRPKSTCQGYEYK